MPENEIGRRIVREVAPGVELDVDVERGVLWLNTKDGCKLRICCLHGEMSDTGGMLDLVCSSTERGIRAVGPRQASKLSKGGMG